MKKIFGLAALAVGLSMNGCAEERTARSETPVSEAEVSTELPESMVSDTTLDAAADVAAEVAATPPPAVVSVPAGTAADNAIAGTASNEQKGNEAQ